MPGLAGFVSVDREVPWRSALEPLVIPLARAANQGVARSGEPGFGVATVHFDDDPLLAESDGTTLAWYGELVDTGSLRAQLKEAGDDRAGDRGLGEVLLACYRRFGIDAVCGLNGLYALSIWHAAERKLILVNDRYGFRRLYYWLGPAGLVFASEMKAVLAHPAFEKKIDETGLIHFLNTTFLLGDHTLFEGIRLLPPASVAVFREGGLTCRRYWNYPFGPTGRKLRREAVHEELAARLRTAVKRRMRDHLCVLVTGGLDSRSLVGAMDPSDINGSICAASSGHRHCHDVRFGRRLARTAGLNHVYLPVTSTYLEEYAEPGMTRTEGTVSCHGYWNAAPDALAREHDVRHVMTGVISGGVRGSGPMMEGLPEKYKDYPGDEGGMRYYYDECFRGGFTDEALTAVLKHDAAAGAADLSYRAVLKRFHEAPTDHMPSKVDYVIMMEEERRFIMENVNMLGELARVQTPLVDNDLVDYSFETRPSEPLGQKLYAELIASQFPHVAGVPRTATGVPINASWLSDKAHRAWMRFYYHVLPAVSLGIWGGHGYHAYVHYDEYLRTGSRRFALGLLGREELLDDLLNMDTVRRVVRDHMEGHTNDYSRVCVLLTLALWRQMYWDPS